MAYTDQEVRQYLTNNLPNASDRQIAAEMVRFGVGSDQIARVMNQTPQAVQERFEAAQAPLANTSLSDNDVRQYLLDRPGYTDAQVASDMIRFGVSPAQVSRATGLPLTDVQARFQAVLDPLRATARGATTTYTNTGGGTTTNGGTTTTTGGGTDNRTVVQTTPITPQTTAAMPTRYIQPSPLTVAGALTPQYTEVPAGIYSLGVPLLNVRNLINLARVPSYVAAPRSTESMTFNPITTVGDQVI
jgi:hypothetical protein